MDFSTLAALTLDTNSMYILFPVRPPDSLNGITDAIQEHRLASSSSVNAVRLDGSMLNSMGYTKDT